MEQQKVELILKEELNFTKIHIEKIRLFQSELLQFNKKYNLISKSSENDIWNRHILDSAQIVKFIQMDNNSSISDIGSGGGFPGIILSIFNSNSNFHVKLYEKSTVKCIFLDKMIKKLDLSGKVYEGSYLNHEINSNHVVSRAFKKLDELLRISREIIKVNHKLIILKGKNALAEINNLSVGVNYRYEVFNSMSEKDSKILIFNITK